MPKSADRHAKHVRNNERKKQQQKVKDRKIKRENKKNARRIGGLR